MKIGIIGAGNMGGAIARGLIENQELTPEQLIICSPNNKYELDILKDKYPTINVSKDNVDAVKSDTDFVIIAVKPWLLQQVIEEIKPYFNPSKQTIVSVVAGASFQEISEMLSVAEAVKIIRLVPNTAISVGESMTFISGNENAKDETSTIAQLFNRMGKAMIVDENLIGAGCALASCGIAYAMRYIRAASEGGVELGFYADKAKEIVMQTMLGAVKLLDYSKESPEVEIDKVTTPIIEGLKASTK